MRFGSVDSVRKDINCLYFSVNAGAEKCWSIKLIWEQRQCTCILFRVAGDEWNSKFYSLSYLWLVHLESFHSCCAFHLNKSRMVHIHLLLLFIIRLLLYKFMFYRFLFSRSFCLRLEEKIGQKSLALTWEILTCNNIMNILWFLFLLHFYHCCCYFLLYFFARFRFFYILHYCCCLFSFVFLFFGGFSLNINDHFLMNVCIANNRAKFVEWYFPIFIFVSEYDGLIDNLLQLRILQIVSDHHFQHLQNQAMTGGAKICLSSRCEWEKCQCEIFWIFDLIETKCEWSRVEKMGLFTWKSSPLDM